VFLTPHDLPEIDKVGLQVSAVSGVPITVCGLCVETIAFAK
jgi:hypothetical protein